MGVYFVFNAEMYIEKKSKQTLKQEGYSYRKQIARQHSCRNFLASCLITMQNLVVISHAVCMHV